MDKGEVRTTTCWHLFIVPGCTNEACNEMTRVWKECDLRSSRRSCCTFLCFMKGRGNMPAAGKGIDANGCH